MSKERIIHARGLSKVYDGEVSEPLTILEGVDLNLTEGESIVITGSSGSGKSTLLNLLGGMDSLTSGDLTSCGYELSRLKERELSQYRANSIGFIFQFHHLLKDFTLWENLLLPAKIKGINYSEAKERGRELLEEVGIANRAKHTPVQLSGGERQRAAIARALMNDPQLILADEPTGNLDEKNSEIIGSLLFRLVKKHKKSLVMVTHERLFADRADNHFHLSHGKIESV